MTTTTTTTITLAGKREDGKATIGGRRVYFGSAAASAVQYREDPQASHDRAVLLGHETHYVILTAGVICGDPGYYEAENAKWAGAPALEIGDRVAVEDALGRREFTIEPAPNQNYRLRPLVG